MEFFRSYHEAPEFEVEFAVVDNRAGDVLSPEGRGFRLEQREASRLPRSFGGVSAPGRRLSALHRQQAPDSGGCPPTRARRSGRSRWCRPGSPPPRRHYGAASGGHLWLSWRRHSTQVASRRRLACCALRAARAQVQDDRGDDLSLCRKAAGACMERQAIAGCREQHRWRWSGAAAGLAGDWSSAAGRPAVTSPAWPQKDRLGALWGLWGPVFTVGQVPTPSLDGRRGGAMTAFAPCGKKQTALPGIRHRRSKAPASSSPAFSRAITGSGRCQGRGREAVFD